MKKETSKIELRSEKVRRVIGNELPFLVRHGITIITVILIGLATVAYMFWKTN